MNWKYKTIIFLTLLIFCVGGVCAADPNNITNGSFDLTVNNTYFDSSVNDSVDSDLIFTGTNLSDDNLTNVLNDSNMTNPELLNQMLQGKFKDLDIGKVMQDISKEDFKKHENNIYSIQLKNLSNSIIHDLNNIDYEIKTTLNSDFKLLTNQINLLKNKNVNHSKVINSSLKTCDKCLHNINGYFYTFRGYLNEITDYLTFRESLKNKNISINDNSVLNIDNTIINSINNKVKCLYVLKCKIEDISSCLNSIKSIVKL